MAVYIDPLFGYGGSATFRWKDSCHMNSDSLDELMTFAVRRLRMKAEWFQDKRLPHFDLNANKRRLAISLGAVEHTREQAVAFWREKGWSRKVLSIEDESNVETTS